MSPALTGGFFTTDLPGKPPINVSVKHSREKLSNFQVRSNKDRLGLQVGSSRESSDNGNNDKFFGNEDLKVAARLPLFIMIVCYSIPIHLSHFCQHPLIFKATRTQVRVGEGNWN